MIYSSKFTLLSSAVFFFVVGKGSSYHFMHELLSYSCQL